LKDAFAEIVNRDIGKIKTADLMSSFCDRILKSGSAEKLSEGEIEDYLERTVTLFAYLTDKDIFSDYYRNQLAKRLLNQRSASDDMERSMIGKLKIRCGAQFTSRLEGMLNDLSIGADSAKKFEEYCKANEARLGLGKLDFTVQVLTTGHWPTYKPLDINIPHIMQRGIAVFKEFYEAETTHRRLQWNFSLGNATVKGVFNKRTYELQVTTVQAVVLMAFNGESVRKFNELQEHTNMNEDTLKRVLHSLAMGKYKVLIKTSGESSSDPKEAKQVKNTDIFTFNDQFSCQHRKFRIPMSSLEDDRNTKRVDEDRTVAIDAAIVRIMKARKTLSHSQLVAEVLAQLAFFRPEGKVVKKQIEALIDREYLERDSENPNTYKYLA
jgi:cullin 1